MEVIISIHKYFYYPFKALWNALTFPSLTGHNTHHVSGHVQAHTQRVSHCRLFCPGEPEHTPGVQ